MVEVSSPRGKPTLLVTLRLMALVGVFFIPLSMAAQTLPSHLLWQAVALVASVQIASLGRQLIRMRWPNA